MVSEHLVPYLFLLGGLLIGVSIFWYIRLWERGRVSKPVEALAEDLKATPPVQTRRLPRLFLIGFIICVVTGPIVLWLMITGQQPSAPEGIRSAQIHELIEKRLPDPALQQTRHEQLIEAIRSIGRRPEPGMAVSAGPVRLTPHFHFPKDTDLIVCFSCLCLLAAGILILVNLSGAWGKLLGILVCIGSLGIFCAFSPNLLTFDTDQIRLEREPSAVGLQLEHLGRVGPFPTARHDADEEVARDRLTPILAGIDEWTTEKRHGFILIIGSADKRPLTGIARDTYGSNAGLAQARAGWVKSLLIQVAAPQLDKSRIILLTTGPENFGLDMPPQVLEADRSVDIYAYWTELARISHQDPR